MINLSVLITCFNKEKYLDDAISSVLRQTRLPKEIIVVHDGCENPMHHVAATTLILKENVGVAKARHKAFEQSTCPLILFLDADDVLSPDYLEKMATSIYLGADVTYPDLYLWADVGSRLTITPDEITKGFVKNFKKVAIPVTSMMKREVFERLGGFKEMEVLEDLDFWIRALKEGYIFKKSQTLIWYRQLKGNRNTLDIKKKRQVLKEIIKQL